MIGDSVEEKCRMGCFGEYLLSEHKIKAYDIVLIRFPEIERFGNSYTPEDVSLCIRDLNKHKCWRWVLKVCEHNAHKQL